MALKIMDHVFGTYGVIDEINLEETAFKMMWMYNQEEPFSNLIEYQEKGQ